MWASIVWRLLITIAGMAMANLCAAQTSAAGTFPSRPLKLVVPFTPGNTADIVARLLSDKLHSSLGQALIVDNRPGAGGILGTDAVAKAEKDGYTLLLTTASPIVINPAIYKKLPYVVERDFIPIVAISTQPMMLVVNPKVPASNLTELIDWMRREKSNVSYASVGAGTFSHLAMEMFSDVIGVQPTHISYKGIGPAQTDLIGGQVSVMFDGLASANAQVKSGRLRPIAVTSSKRSPYASQVPTVMESGVSGLGDFEISAWVGLFAPMGTPLPVIQRIKTEVDRVLMQPEFAQALAATSMTAIQPQTQQQFGDQVRRDSERWARAARNAKLDPSN